MHLMMITLMWMTLMIPTKRKEKEAILGKKSTKEVGMSFKRTQKAVLVA
jgi:hypothetical protein